MRSEGKQLSAASCEDDQLTVDNLRQLLEIISKAGYGNMMLYLGESTPLMRSSISIYYPENKLLIRNGYYDKAITGAADKMKSSIVNAINEYISDCCNAGILKDESEGVNMWNID